MDNLDSFSRTIFELAARNLFCCLLFIEEKSTTITSLLKILDLPILQDVFSFVLNLIGYFLLGM